MEHKAILRRVGGTLLALGLFDIAIMAYCIATSRNYSSSFNILAVIAGVFLLRGSTKAAGIAVQFAAFLLALPVAVVVFPLVYPLDLFALQLRLHPLQGLTTAILTALFFGVTYWAFMELTRPEVAAAIAAAGHTRGSPRNSFLAGSAVIIAVSALVHLAMSGETAQEAITRARAVAGPGYKFHVDSFESSSAAGSGTHVTAVVSAYNSVEIRTINLEWKK